jgi:hypothetical protein
MIFIGAVTCKAIIDRQVAKPKFLCFTFKQGMRWNCEDRVMVGKLEESKEKKKKRNIDQMHQHMQTRGVEPWLLLEIYFWIRPTPRPLPALIFLLVGEQK